MTEYFDEKKDTFTLMKSMTQFFSYGEYTLWNNEAITIYSFFWKSWVERGIYFIHSKLQWKLLDAWWIPKQVSY